MSNEQMEGVDARDPRKAEVRGPSNKLDMLSEK